MDWCRVVGPRGLCRPLDEKQVSNKQPGPRALSGQGRAGQGRAGAGQERPDPQHPRCLEFASLGPQTPLEVPLQTPQKSTDHANGGGFGVLLYCLTAKKSFAGRRHYSPRVPGGFTLPHRAVGTLGRGPRSEPRAPMQMVSGALGSLGLRV